jgi:hypothetical protein
VGRWQSDEIDDRSNGFTNASDGFDEDVRGESER